jgi:hypothetical protein
MGARPFVDLRISARVFPPLWPGAFDLAINGPPLGVALLELDVDLFAVVVLDLAGELLELRRLPLRFAVRWCLNRHLRFFLSLGELVRQLQAGRVVGWLHGVHTERKDARVRLVVPLSFSEA